jgi:signal transduction histidine kinase
MLDTLSLKVSTSDSALLFGALDSARRSLHVHVVSPGPLKDVSIDVAITPEQLLHQHLILPFRRERLWPLGVLTLATILVTAIAIGTARREALLARARSEFIAGISHDLRMPLAQILLAGETLALQRDRNEAERVAFATSIVREARRLVGLVDNVLLFSKTGAVELKPRLQPVAVRELFADVIESVQLAVDDVKQTISASPADNVVVMGDRTLLRQALANLVDNAIKYGQQGQHIALRVDTSDDTHVCLIVDDQGPGVPVSQRKAVFERYERLERDLGSERTGSGLGLSVVSHIAHACKGRAFLTDAPGGGARAVLELQTARL